MRADQGLGNSPDQAEQRFRLTTAGELHPTWYRAGRNSRYEVSRPSPRSPAAWPCPAQAPPPNRKSSINRSRSCAISDKSRRSEIPPRILDDARGLAIIRVLKIGFGVSGKGGQGVVVARTAHGWSAPSFIGLGGAGWGLQIGAQVSDFIFVLNNDAAVRAFSRDGNVKIGADVSAAAGPVGRDLQGASHRRPRSTLTAGARGSSPAFRWKARSSRTQKTPTPATTDGSSARARSWRGRVSPTGGTQRLLGILSRY